MERSVHRSSSSSSSFASIKFIISALVFATMKWYATYFVTFVALCTLGIEVVQAASPTYDIMKYGATGNGITDDSNAFLKAWADACGDNGEGGAPTFYVPEGKFLLNPIYFVGPCKASSINVQIDGTLVAPNSTNWKWRNGHSGTWLAFSDVNNLAVGGSGSIDGQGSNWWHAAETTSNDERPTSLSFHTCTNLVLSGLHSINSPRNHITIDKCDGSTVQNLTIVAPESSPNTDGIDVTDSTNAKFLDLDIQTGDDCIALGDQSTYINIERVTCGPGHGISVGSLGKDGAYNTVEAVYVKNCTFRGSRNGARIKTWQSGSGYVKNITFDQIILEAVRNPIIIDQFYMDESSSLNVYNVTFSGFRGTSVDHPVISLECARDPGCFDITLDDVQITVTEPEGSPMVVCNNARGSATSTLPNVTCLSR